MDDAIALWVRTCIAFSVPQLDMQQKQKICFNIFTWLFLLVMAYVISLVSINYVSCIWPIWFLFLTKPKPVYFYGNNFFLSPSSFRIIINLFAHGIYQVWSIIWQLSLSRTEMWVWTNLQEIWTLISILLFTLYIIWTNRATFISFRIISLKMNGFSKIFLYIVYKLPPFINVSQYNFISPVISHNQIRKLIEVPVLFFSLYTDIYILISHFLELFVIVNVDFFHKNMYTQMK